MGACVPFTELAAILPRDSVYRIVSVSLRGCQLLVSGMRRSWLNAREVTLIPGGVVRRILSASSMLRITSVTMTESKPASMPHKPQKR
jgi:hypothetical protein